MASVRKLSLRSAGRVQSALRLALRFRPSFPASWPKGLQAKADLGRRRLESSGLQARRIVSHSYDVMGRLNVVDTMLPTAAQPNPAWQSVISNVQFNAFGDVTSLNHLGLTESRQHNLLGQLTRMTKGSLIDVEYRFSTTANDGKILSQKNWLNGEDVVYAYDELERLISASTTAGSQSWGLSWTYDGFGNRLAQGAGSVNSVLDNANTNWISSSGYNYDANGEMTLMSKGTGSMTMDYDLSNRLKQVTHPHGTEQYGYAPDNRRVWRSAGRTALCSGMDDSGSSIPTGCGEAAREQLVFYSPGGQKMGVYGLNPSQRGQYVAITASEENVFYGGRLVGKRLVIVSGTGSGLVSDFTADRLQSKGDGSRFYPYGESKTGVAGDDREQFATYTRDGGSGLDYADQRFYSALIGRFLSTDPAGAGLNHYADADPSNGYDPSGLLTVIVSGTGEQNALWSRPGSEMFNTIRDTFAETNACTFVFDWSSSLLSTTTGGPMREAAILLQRFIEGRSIGCPNQPLNLVGYSHGGNVIIDYTNLSNSRPKTNVVTMGTPSRWDFEINNSNVSNCCAISRTDDLVRFSGASPAQLSAFGYFSTEAYRAYSRSLSASSWISAFWHFTRAIQANAIAAWFMMDARRQPQARNFMIQGGLFLSRDAHSLVRTGSAWRFASSHPNWNCRAAGR